MIKDKIDQHIKSRGHSLVCVDVDKDSPIFAYTVGLTESCQHAELLIFGLPRQASVDILSGIIDRVNTNGPLRDGDTIETLTNFPLCVKTVPLSAAADYANLAISQYSDRQAPTFVQIVLPDEAGKWPWDAAYDQEMTVFQPNLWRV